ncbi:MULTISPECIES: hypothetical protein [unclassified Bartonella]|uniref:hypothetical protein n=1 Tax=unclassified Bartonella TaxID=2645622 RepID=UPI0015FA1DF1|nr:MULTISPECIES: hypothetical protein [unclassified Bartonella]UXM96072.1 hypothetical protein N5853_05490 [Bartonella sp. HY329]UXN04214.1 hypothetical protein N6B01_04050 [Bartonella sp. HY406]UXN07204.1 hypothetical protein N6A79_04135 [Bartonella sp. HY761]UXN10396.1 hypothetical protein N5852_05495 [Bartonella sp. HY328]
MTKQVPLEVSPLRSSHNVIMSIVEYGFIICITCLSIAAATLILIEQLSIIW